MIASRARRGLTGWVSGGFMILGCGFALTACSRSGGTLARSACVHIDRSLHLYKEASVAPDRAQAHALGQQAYIELRDALPIAAAAAGQNAQWQALMTTVSESNQLPESDLVKALTAQCASANRTNQFPAPPPPP
ncbi:MAG: hypothetical protein ACYCV7_15060, partial [Acidimicrobiales bacterium]